MIEYWRGDTCYQRYEWAGRCVMCVTLSPTPTQAESSDFDLALLLAMTDLLASCSEGENLFIESVCQKVFTVEELLAILNSPSLPSERKRPFARFIVSVYMNTGGDKHSSGAALLAQSE